MNTKTQNAILKIVAILLVVGLFRSIPNKKAENNIKIQLQNSFIKGCTEDSPYDTCKCAFNALYDDLGQTEFINASIDYAETGKLDRSMIATILNANCLE